MIQEQWKPIPGFEKYYEISSLGRISSFDRPPPCGRGHSMRLAQAIRARPNKDGYLETCLSMNKKKYMRKVHRLVALAFIHNPDGKPMVCHRDGDILNNSIENLYWGDSMTNAADTIRHGRQPRGERCGVAKLNNDKVRLIRALYPEKSINQIAKQIKSSYGAVDAVVKGRTWTHVA
jgi:hypothetical protein